MTTKINELLFPFEDFFQKHSGNILGFGQAARDIALEHVKQFGTAVDIGAHVGISVHCWAPRFQQVVAFEPMVDHYECLVENTKKFSNVSTHNCAISNESRTLRGTYRSRKNSGSFQLLTDDWQPNPKKAQPEIYNIPSRRLDEFDLENVDLIKIDVEGWELEVLKGARETIKRCQPVLMIEFTQGGGREHKSMNTYDVNDYHNLIEELGYQLVGQANDDYIYCVKHD